MPLQYPFNAPTPDEPITGFLFRIASWCWASVSGSVPIKIDTGGGTAAWSTNNGTIAGGAGFTTLTSQPATAVELVNNTGVSLDVQRVGSGGFVPLPTGSFQTIPVVANASEISVRRTDNGAAISTGWGWYVFD